MLPSSGSASGRETGPPALSLETSECHCPLTDRDTSSRPGPGSQFTKESILRDYRTAFQSRQASLIGRREVFTGKAKFGIFGDGKEVAQLALARAFHPGDFRSGYYRDQTLMMALGLLTVEEFFAQLYADADIEREPCSAGRSMTAHFGTCMLGPDGEPRSLVDLLNSSSDVSPTGSQMPRLVGLAYASRLYRELPELREAGASVLEERRRDRLRHHRQRELRRGDVLGGRERHRRPGRPGDDLDLGRRLRHLRRQRAPDHQG